MSEHTPLTEAEREAIEAALDGGRVYDDVPSVAQQIKSAAIASAEPLLIEENAALWKQLDQERDARERAETLLAARTSTATAATAFPAAAFRHDDGAICLYNAASGTWYANDDGRMLLSPRPVCERDHPTADIGLRERVEAVLSLYANGHCGAIRALTMIQTALDATPASTEDRADNEGTR